MLKTELQNIEEFIRAQLLGDGAITNMVGGRIYKNHAKHETEFPLIVFSYQQGSDIVSATGNRIITSAVYSVRAVAVLPSGTADLADRVAAEIDRLLDQRVYELPGLVYQVSRVSPITREYTIDGIDYEERGGLYRFYAVRQGY